MKLVDRKACNCNADKHTATSFLLRFFDPCQMSQEWWMPLSLNSPLSVWCREMMNEMPNHSYMVKWYNHAEITLTKKCCYLAVCICADFGHIQLFSKCLQGTDKALLLHNNRISVSLPLVNVHHGNYFLRSIVHGCVCAVLCTEPWAIHTSVTFE